MNCHIRRPANRRRKHSAPLSWMLLLSTVVLVSGCQTTAENDFMSEKYSVAVNCVRSHVDGQLTPKPETEAEIGTLVRAGLNACSTPMKAYIEAVVREIMDRNRWVWMGEESRQAITEEIVLSTSVVLQHEYNEKEGKP